MPVTPPLPPNLAPIFIQGRVTQTGRHYNAHVVAPTAQIAQVMATQQLAVHGLSNKVKPGSNVTLRGVLPMGPVPPAYVLALPQFLPFYPPLGLPVGAYIVRYRRARRDQRAEWSDTVQKQKAQARRAARAVRRATSYGASDEMVPLYGGDEAEATTLTEHWDDLPSWAQYSLGGVVVVGSLFGISALVRRFTERL